MGRIVMINYSFWGIFMFTSICVALCIFYFKWLNIWTLITSSLYNNKYSLFKKTKNKKKITHNPNPHKPIDRNEIPLTSVSNKDHS